jgi:hypothetical protein
MSMLPTADQHAFVLQTRQEILDRRLAHTGLLGEGTHRAVDKIGLGQQCKENKVPWHAEAATSPRAAYRRAALDMGEKGIVER